jgi:hypothetical protein
LETLALGGSSLYGILAIDGDVLVISWTEFFYRKVVGFSPKVGFPQDKLSCSCVVFLWLLCMVDISRSCYFRCIAIVEIFSVYYIVILR